MPPKISVVKYSGEKQVYNQSKVVGSIIRSGIAEASVGGILGRVEGKLYDGISTKELYQIVAQEIQNIDPKEAGVHYQLRDILAKMGSIDFERYIEKVLQLRGFQCQWNVIVPGVCSEHQIDILAEDKNGKKIFVEVKHHTNPHREGGLGTVAELWARLEDVQGGFQRGKNSYEFDSAWLICNTKFSEHAKEYAKCKKLKLTGWRYDLDGFGHGFSGVGLEEEAKKIDVVKFKKELLRTIQEEGGERNV